MFTLRAYQQQAKDEVRRAFKYGKRRVVLCKPTGSGKTVTFASIIADAIPKGTTAMIMCDRKELIGQAKDKVNSLGLTPTIIAPNYSQRKNSLYLASVDTLRRREFPKIDLLIIDEAHKQTFDKTISKYIELCNPFIIGATATPLRTGGQNSLSEYYQDIIEPVKINDLLDMGFLVPARTFASKEDFSDVKRRGQEYDNAAIFDKFNQPELYDGAVDNYNKFSPDKKAICFNVNVQHSINMVDKFRDSGISAAHLDGKTPDIERRKILADYKRGEFKILSNCSVLTTGYDEPSIETVIVNRATLSLPLWLQMVGRGSRTFENKPNFTVIDQGANVYRHGLWHEEREWSLYKKPKGDGVAPVKCCEECGALNHSSARVCVECGHEFEIKKKELKEAEFVEVKDDFRKRRGFDKKPDPRTASMSELHEYAKKMGYSPKWPYVQFKIYDRL